MKIISLTALALLATSCSKTETKNNNELASTRVEGTKLVCTDVDESAAPAFTFVFNFKGKLSNPSKVSINVIPSAFVGSEEVVQESKVEGCQNIAVSESESGVDFECGGDGDGGFGSLNTLTEGLSIGGEITFPEGKDLGRFRVDEDTSIKLNCSIASDEQVEETQQVKSFFLADLGPDLGLRFLAKQGSKTAVLTHPSSIYAAEGGRSTLKIGGDDCSTCLYLKNPETKKWVNVAKQNGKVLETTVGRAVYKADGYTITDSSVLEAHILKNEPEYGHISVNWN